MLKVRKGFEDAIIEYKLGTVKVKMAVKDITQQHIDNAKIYGIYLDEFMVNEPVKYNPKKHDIETIIQAKLNSDDGTRD